MIRAFSCARFEEIQTGTTSSVLPISPSLLERKAIRHGQDEALQGHVFVLHPGKHRIQGGSVVWLKAAAEGVSEHLPGERP